MHKLYLYMDNKAQYYPKYNYNYDTNSLNFIVDVDISNKGNCILNHIFIKMPPEFYGIVVSRHRDIIVNNNVVPPNFIGRLDYICFHALHYSYINVKGIIASLFLIPTNKVEMHEFECIDEINCESEKNIEAKEIIYSFKQLIDTENKRRSELCDKSIKTEKRIITSLLLKNVEGIVFGDKIIDEMVEYIYVQKKYPNADFDKAWGYKYELFKCNSLEEAVAKMKNYKDSGWHYYYKWNTELEGFHYVLIIIRYIKDPWGS